MGTNWGWRKLFPPIYFRLRNRNDFLGEIAKVLEVCFVFIIGIHIFGNQNVLAGYMPP
jgi:hypothetical protein